MKNKIPLVFIGVWLVLALPVTGAASGYEALKREKANYTLPTYPSVPITDLKQP